jgi:hypothetical protein
MIVGLLGVTIEIQSSFMSTVVCDENDSAHRLKSRCAGRISKCDMPLFLTGSLYAGPSPITPCVPLVVTAGMCMVEPKSHPL